MRRLLLSGLFLLNSIAAFCNNVTIDSLNMVDSINVSFRISWDNAWNMPDTIPYNNDACWVFLKYRSAEHWNHLDVSSISVDHIPGAGAKIIAVPDAKGVFISFANKAEGTLNARIQLKLNSALPPGSYDIRAFAIEMVNIKEGAFYIGDSVSHNAFRDAGTQGPYKITSESSIISGTAAGSLDNSITYPPSGNIPAVYPKGFEEFYVMKYEISQEQYTGFLNTLNFAQQTSRTASSPSAAAGSFIMSGFMQQANRNSVIITNSGNSSMPAQYGMNADNDATYNEAGDGSARACNFLSWQDLLAYLDWSGLRPMTEFEFEKACRGNSYPKALEFAWGTDKVIDANTTQNDGFLNETVTEKGDTATGVAVHGYAGPFGPLKCGFNGSATSTKNESGSSYYGCKELSGNLWEQCVSVTTEGLSFDGSNGDGTLDAGGNANVQGWNTSGDAASIRGGGWNSGIQPGFRDLAVSDRFYGSFNTTTRRNTTGGRGCRRIQ